MTTTDASREAQFALERTLRHRILESTRGNRLAVTAAAYAELFEKFPDHGAMSPTGESRRSSERRTAAMIMPLTRGGDRVLEVGCGRGGVLRELARTGRICVGIESSRHMIGLRDAPPEVGILFGTADKLEFADGSFDLVFSQQVLEHLHPEDVPLHFAEACRVLRPGGILAVETPNRRTGPQDISRGFVSTAEGLHLKEWYLYELVAQFRRAGFIKLRGLLAPPFLARRSAMLHRASRIPIVIKQAEDSLLAMIPGLGLRTLVGKIIGLDDVFMFGRRPCA